MVFEKNSRLRGSKVFLSLLSSCDTIYLALKINLKKVEWSSRYFGGNHVLYEFKVICFVV
jgi:hypothetical protein